jgi:UDP-N-acetyl-2-amino-2-deoxyglucuronate dehydrogenase
MTVKNFAIIGVGGYVAPRHLKAIHDTGNRLIAAVDPKDSVGILDQYDFDISYFTEIERFDRHLDKLRRRSEEERAHYISICSPNYLHDAHCRLAMRLGTDVICEKPLVISPWNLDALEELEQETGHRIHTILQLRLHPELLKLRESLRNETTGKQHDVILTYITGRGNWYHVSWKGQNEKSGGIATNIGIHLFDLLIWLFGYAGEIRLYHSDPKCMSGFIEMERARVRWFLSVDINDLPHPVVSGGHTTYRSITVDGREIEFSEGFTDLHTRVYEETLAGRGFRIADARPSIELTYRIRMSVESPLDSLSHPFIDSTQHSLASDSEKSKPLHD